MRDISLYKSRLPKRQSREWSRFKVSYIYLVGAYLLSHNGKHNQSVKEKACVERIARAFNTPKRRRSKYFSSDATRDFSEYETAHWNQ